MSNNKNKNTETQGSKKIGSTKTKKKSPYFVQKIIAFFLIFCFVIGVGGGVWALIYVQKVIEYANSLNINRIETTSSSKIVNADGTQVISDLGVSSTENVTYDELPQVVIDALISVEDSRYFEHNGFDIPRFLKAMLNNAKCLCFDEGGSTLTMQTIKNTYFVDDETGQQATTGINGISRKITEIYLAPQLESIMSKEEIIALYLNSSNYGVSGSKGISIAAETLFGKEVSELNLSEAAYLVGVVNSPASYNPFFDYAGILGYLDNATERRDQVLYLMNYHGYISDEEYALAKSIKLEDLFVDQGTSSEALKATYRYQAYIDAVLAEVEEVTGNDPDEVPMTIYTYIDTDLQELLEAIGNGDYTTDNYDITTSQQVSWEGDGELQAALSIIDNDTGAIIATLGGRDYYGKKLNQRAVNARVSPGSTAKPILEYLLAFEYLGYSTGDSVMDLPGYTYAGTNLAVNNWDNLFKGQVYLEYAIGDSRNIPAVETYDAVKNLIGESAIASYLKSIGFDEDVADAVQSQYAIGGSTFVATPTQMANAYQMILNGGNYIKAHTIKEIQYEDGRDPYVSDSTATKIVSSAASYLMAYMLEKVVNPGYASTVNLLKGKSYDVFAKTGTSTNEDGSVKNRWLFTGTTEFSWSTWIGYDYNDPITTSQNRYNHAGRINAAILNALEAKYGKPSNLSTPSDVTEITFIKGTSNIDATTGIVTHAQPLTNMSSDMLQKGYIKTSFAALTSIEETLKPETLADTVQVVVTPSGNQYQASITMPAYADTDMLTKNNGTLLMSNGATGALQFHKTWIYGPIRYYAEVRSADGTVIETTKSESSTFNINFSGSGNLQVCTYYAYDTNSDIRSNEICRSVTVAEASVSVPNFLNNQPKSVFESFATTYSLNVTYEDYATNDANLDGTIAAVSPSISGTSTTLSILQSQHYTVKIYKYNP